MRWTTVRPATILLLASVLLLPVADAHPCVGCFDGCGSDDWHVHVHPERSCMTTLFPFLLHLVADVHEKVDDLIP